MSPTRDDDGLLPLVLVDGFGPMYEAISHVFDTSSLSFASLALCLSPLAWLVDAVLPIVEISKSLLHTLQWAFNDVGALRTHAENFSSLSQLSWKWQFPGICKSSSIPVYMP